MIKLADAPFGDRAVQLLHGRQLVAERGDLAEHVDPPVELIGFRDLDERRADPFRAVDPFCRDPEPSGVKLLQRFSDGIRRGPFTHQPTTFGLETCDKWRGGHSDLVAGSGLEQDRRVTADRLVLEPLDDRPGADGLPREEIGRADQHANSHAQPCQWRGQSGHKRSGSAVVDAPGEGDVNLLGGNPPINRAEENFDGLLPEQEARPGANVPATLAPLQHEPPRPIAEELVEQAGRRDVQKRRDPRAFQLAGLIGTTPGDQGERRLRFENRGDLLGPKLGQDEAKYPDAPRSTRE